MPFVLRVTQLPPLGEIQRIPQIVIVDGTGPAIPLSGAPRLAMLVGEALDGPVNKPFELTSGGQFGAIFGGISALLSQDAAGVQNGGGLSSVGAVVGTFEGNGPLQLLGKRFKRLGFTRVDTRAVTTDGGTNPSQLQVTLTIAAADQAAGVLNKAITVPAGARFGNNADPSVATEVVAAAVTTTLAKGTVVTANQVTFTVPVFVVKEPEPIVTIAAASIAAVIDATLQNVSTGTSVTGVVQASAIWPPGTGTTLRARIDSRYPAALNATLPSDADVTQEIKVIWSARRSAAIRAALRANVDAASGVAAGRIAVVDAEPPASSSAVDAAAGVAAAAALAAGESLQDDRLMGAFPRTQVSVPDFGGVAVTINSSGWTASILSNFANERNPGANPAGLLDAIVGVEDAYQQNPLAKQDYVNLLAGGISPIQKDRTVGWWLVNGVTMANPGTQPTRVPAKRRTMADEIQDKLAEIAAPYQKEPATTERVDSFVSELEAYFLGLQSPNLPGAQRIVGSFVDAVSQNTPELEALGIFVIQTSVRTLPSMDEIVFNTQIGETVVLPAAA